MTIKQICDVLYDSQKVEVYEDRNSYEPVVWGVAQQLRNGKYANASVDVVVPSGKTMLIYLD